MEEEVSQAITSLDNWIQRNGWAGYDPYDIKEHPLMLKLPSYKNRNSVTKIAAGALLIAIDRFPHTTRKLLNVDKRINAKAMGLFASAYLKLHDQFGDETYLVNAMQCIDWLEQNKSQGYSGACWGYPCNWQSLIFIPRNTPSGVVTSICGNAFWDFYKFTNERKYLDFCESICNFLIGDLNIDNVSNDRACFSYTPLDRFHVHNSNLMIAEFLIKVGKKLDKIVFTQ